MGTGPSRPVPLLVPARLPVPTERDLVRGAEPLPIETTFTGLIYNRSRDDWRVDVQGDARLSRVPGKAMARGCTHPCFSSGVLDALNVPSRSFRVRSKETVQVVYAPSRVERKGPGVLCDVSGNTTKFGGFLAKEEPFVGEGVIALTCMRPSSPESNFPVRFTLSRTREVTFFRTTSMMNTYYRAGRRKIVNVNDSRRYETDLRTHGIALNRGSDDSSVNGEKKLGCITLF